MPGSRHLSDLHSPKSPNSTIIEHTTSRLPSSRSSQTTIRQSCLYEAWHRAAHTFTLFSHRPRGSIKRSHPARCTQTRDSAREVRVHEASRHASSPTVFFHGSIPVSVAATPDRSSSTAHGTVNRGRYAWPRHRTPAPAPRSTYFPALQAHLPGTVPPRRPQPVNTSTGSRPRRDYRVPAPLRPSRATPPPDRRTSTAEPFLARSPRTSSRVTRGQSGLSSILSFCPGSEIENKAFSRFPFLPDL